MPQDSNLNEEERMKTGRWSEQFVYAYLKRTIEVLGSARSAPRAPQLVFFANIQFIRAKLTHATSPNSSCAIRSFLQAPLVSTVPQASCLRDFVERVSKFKMFHRARADVNCEMHPPPWVIVDEDTIHIPHDCLPPLAEAVQRESRTLRREGGPRLPGAAAQLDVPWPRIVVRSIKSDIP